MPERAPIERLLHPKSITVIGGRFAAAVIEQCERSGFEGPIWPVNPQRREMAGRPCYPDIESLPGRPDAAFIAISKEKTIAAVQALSLKGAGGAVCYASGFSEMGQAGAHLELQLVESLGDLAVVGPNCYGMLNYLDGVALWPDQHGGQRIDRGAALIMQSGNMALSLTMQQRSLPLAYVISVGNMAGLKLHDYVGALVRDPRVTAIGIHMEGLQDVAALSRAALEALRRRIPIVVLKTGVSTRGQELVLSHTSSLSGSDDLFQAFCDRFGLQRVGSLAALLETLKFLSVIGPLPGGSIASISCSGGEAALVADTAHRLDIPIAPLNDPQKHALRAVLGDRVALNNPLDYHTYIWGDAEAQTRCFAGMMLGKQDVTLKVLDYPRGDRSDQTNWVQTGLAFFRAAEMRGGRAAVVSTLAENFPSEQREFFLAHGIAPMQGLEECLLAVRAAARVYEKQQATGQVLPLDPISARGGEAVTLSEGESKKILARHSIRVPRYEICSLENGLEAARRIGYPLALKIHSREIFHKSDRGGVFLDIREDGQAREALDSLGQIGSQVIVEEMIPTPAAELLLGLTSDHTFGLALVIGAGGVQVELIQDIQTLLFTVQEGDIYAALEKLRIWPLLNGDLGRPAADTGAFVRAAMALADFGQRHAAEIVEVDINPLFVMADGGGAVAVDAGIRVVGNSKYFRDGILKQEEIEHGE